MPISRMVLESPFSDRPLSIKSEQEETKKFLEHIENFDNFDTNKEKKCKWLHICRRLNIEAISLFYNPLRVTFVKHYTQFGTQHRILWSCTNTVILATIYTSSCGYSDITLMVSWWHIKANIKALQLRVLPPFQCLVPLPECSEVFCISHWWV